MTRLSGEGDSGAVRHMRRAILLARRGLGRVSPNPPVGCVLVRDGVVVGTGWHRRYGDLHAEAMALEAAGEAARGATAYVTLMPCAHQGKQPPCADALVRAGVAEVVVACDDPNPDAAGGRAVLERSGVRVETGLLGEAAAGVMRGFLKRVRTGLPFVTLKYAMTLDGKIAATGGNSRWISGEVSRHLVHRCRRRVDAVLGGLGTALADDPELTARGLPPSADGSAPPPPLRVVVDARGRLPATARMLSTPGGRAVVLCGDGVSEAVRAGWRGRGAAVEAFAPEAGGRVPLAAALRRLAEGYGVNTVLCEGGAGLAAGLLRAGLVDETAVFIAPKMVGGHDAPGPVATLGIERMASALTMSTTVWRRVGEDFLVTARPEMR